MNLNIIQLVIKAKDPNFYPTSYGIEKSENPKIFKINLVNSMINLRISYVNV